MVRTSQNKSVRATYFKRHSLRFQSQWTCMNVQTGVVLVSKPDLTPQTEIHNRTLLPNANICTSFVFFRNGGVSKSS